MHMVASASVMQPIQYKIGSSNKFETLKNELRILSEPLQGR